MPQPRPIAFLDARLIDPDRLEESRGGALVVDGKIAALGPAVRRDAVPPDAQIVECGGDVVAPGLIDMRAFIGEPGAEHRETIASASAAAAAGGVTTLVARPDTNPPVDDPAVVDFILRRARATAKVRVLPTAALTKGLEGREIAEIGLLAEAGAVAFSDGPLSVANAQTMRRALTYARDFGALVIHSCEDRDLVGEGVMAEGERASRLGLPGIPREAETVVLERDLRLVALTGARYHAALVSNRLSLEAMARARAAACRPPAARRSTISRSTRTTSATIAPSSSSTRRCAARTSARRWSTRLNDGLIDVIVSDHDPQDVETKRLPFGEAVAWRDRRRDDAVGEPAPGRRRAHLAAAAAAGDDDPAGGNPRPAQRPARSSARRPTSSASIPRRPMCSTRRRCIRTAATRRSTRRGSKARSR